MTAHPLLLAPRLDPDATLRDIVREFPATIRAFHVLGVDLRQAATRTLRDAARDLGVSCFSLRTELERTL